MNNKMLTEEDCEEMLGKIATHSMTVWRISSKLYQCSTNNLIPDNYKLAVNMLIKIVDGYIAMLEDVKFLEKKTIN